MNEREAYICIVSGQKAVGKTFFSRKNVLDKYIQDTPNRKGKPVIIFDTNSEYTDIKTIYFDIDQYSEEKGKKRVYNNQKIAEHVFAYCKNCFEGKSKPEIRRIIPNKKDGSPMSIDEKMTTATILLEYVRGGLLLLEDFNNYCIGATALEVISSITTNRHKGLDIMIHLQSMSALTPRLIQNTTLIRMHKQSDPIKRIKNKLPNLQLFEIAESMVNSEFNNGNKRFMLYVHPEHSKISFFNLNKKDILRIFEKGCIDYLAKNPAVFKDFCTPRINKSLMKMTIEERTDMQKEFIKEHLYYIGSKKTN